MRPQSHTLMSEEIARWKRFAMQRKEGKLMERAPQDRDMSGAEDAIPNFDTVGEFDFHA